MKYTTLILAVSILLFHSCDLDVKPDIILDFTVDFTLTTPDEGNTCFFPCTVNLDNTSNVSEGTTFQWKFGDGETFAGDEPLSHMYPDIPGVYTIVLCAIRPNGDTLVASQTVNVVDPVADPQPSFTIPSGTCFAPCTMTFTNTSTNAENYSWDFGDNTPEVSTTSSDPIQHTFTKSGVYTVTLTGINGDKEMSFELDVVVDMRTFAEAHLNQQTGRAIIELDDGSFMIFSSRNNNLNILKTKINGNPEIETGFPNEIPFTYNVQIVDAIMLSSGAIAVLGHTEDNDLAFKRLILFRVDQNGELLTDPPLLINDTNLEVADKNIEAVALAQADGESVMIVGSASIANGAIQVYIRRRSTVSNSGSPSTLVAGSGSGNFIASAITRVGDNFAISASLGGADFKGSLIMVNDDAALLNGFPRDLDPNHISTYSIFTKTNGNLLVCGLTSALDVYLAEYPANGLGGFLSSTIIESNISPAKLQRSANGEEYVLIGRKNNQACMVGLDENGSINFPVKFYGDSFNSTLFSATSTLDCGWSATGFSSSESTLFHLKTDENGN